LCDNTLNSSDATRETAATRPGYPYRPADDLGHRRRESQLTELPTPSSEEKRQHA